MATIVHLQIAAAHRAPMQSQASVRAVTGLGLEGDHHAKAESARQILLMDEETLAAFGLRAGSVRENITTRGIELKTLAMGARLRVGEAVLEITKPCAPCEFIDDIREGLRADGGTARHARARGGERDDARGGWDRGGGKRKTQNVKRET
jgi:MOSC domain-containing protein YiiM